MTPQEKALQLCQRFGFLGMQWEQTGFYTLNLNNSKQCAIICVDEIIWDAIKYSDNSKEYVTKNIEYWEQVKQEIINL